ncbi:hypothetical protein TKWG_18830 [Advenella kashmirensis WT001]|uniref:Uncharacterized protein n=1 Tax=Advenella kashmirensis (strain DSM 17095 / LMG 22695 / WT001) TaxID=1036672 RepID=I3UF09_ADVKW|nr:hypothetical protein TKWG_18830 [Advenella kashmirensis WT001]
MMERVEVLKGPGTLMYGISPTAVSAETSIS